MRSGAEGAVEEAEPGLNSGGTQTSRPTRDLAPSTAFADQQPQSDFGGRAREARRRSTTRCDRRLHCRWVRTRMIDGAEAADSFPTSRNLGDFDEAWLKSPKRRPTLGRSNTSGLDRRTRWSNSAGVIPISSSSWRISGHHAARRRAKPLAGSRRRRLAARESRCSTAARRREYQGKGSSSAIRSST